MENEGLMEETADVKDGGAMDAAKDSLTNTKGPRTRRQIGKMKLEQVVKAVDDEKNTVEEVARTVKDEKKADEEGSQRKTDGRNSTMESPPQYLSARGPLLLSMCNASKRESVESLALNGYAKLVIILCPTCNDLNIKVIKNSKK